MGRIDAAIGGEWTRGGREPSRTLDGAWVERVVYEAGRTIMGDTTGER